MLDRVKAQGYKYSTKGAVTVAVSDAVIPPQKAELLASAEEQIGKITKQYNKGLISNEERYNGAVSYTHLPRTLEEVGKEFNVTRERIRQIEAKALRKLRHPSRSKKLRDFLD